MSLSPAELMSGMDNPYTDMKHLRRALNIDITRLSETSGVPVEELKRIEAGEAMPLEKLRDIAMCLGTSVMGILGKGYFQTQVTMTDDLVRDKEVTIHSPGGFWGHLGVLLCGQPKYMWFPITNFTRRLIDQNNAEKYMAIPCMDNSLLLVNCARVEELALLDDACDAPAGMDWDCGVSCGESPNVIYEAFDDYMLYKETPKADPADYDMSESFVKTLDRFLDKKGTDPETFDAELNTATVFFSSGRVQHHLLTIDCAEDLTTAVSQIYEAGELFGDEMILIEELTGTEIRINFKNIAMIKLPLARVEKDLNTTFEEIEKDLQ